MLAGDFPGMGPPSSEDGKITTLLIICCVTASTGSFISSYCFNLFFGPNGIIFRESFLNKFYPELLEHRRKMKKNSNPNSDPNGNYCLHLHQYKDVLTFIYSMFIATLMANFVASYNTRRFGRKHTVFFAGILFTLGSIFSTAAQHLSMFFIGWILLGCGSGFAYQAVPIYLSEIAPTRRRGALNILFQLNVGVGSLFADIVGYGTRRMREEWHWRLLLGSVGIFAVIFTISSYFIVETPNSLMERGHLDKGKEVLRKIRDIDHNHSNIELEFLVLIEASKVAKKVKHPFKNLLIRRNMPPLVTTMVFKMFSWFSGINFIIAYMKAFLPTIGYDMSDQVHDFYVDTAIKVVCVISIATSMIFVDKMGRRKLLLEAGLHMFLSHFLIAIILGIKVKDQYSSNLSHGLATFVVILICTFISSYSWSWGALDWLIPIEIFPLETRSVGQGVVTFVYLLYALMFWNICVPLLYRFKFGIFFFFSGWILIMSFFVVFFLPETKNIPIEEMTDRVWKRHWFWKRFFND